MSAFSRRKFIMNMGLGTSVIGASGLPSIHARSSVNIKPEARWPRQVWIAAMIQQGMQGPSLSDVISAALKQMEIALPCSPDVICLPEVFHEVGVRSGRPSLDEASEDGSGKIIGPFQDFARQHHCYIICPVYAKENGKYYNAAYVIDRKGQVLGNYKKVRPTIGEIKESISPGPSDIPVFDTDFGRIGIQICYDIEWNQGWEQLRRKGAEIVFWPSAFAGGTKVNAKAWTHQYVVVASTRKDTTKICDITGEPVVESGLWSSWGICAPVNLEKAIIHSWPAALKFPEMQRKYGRSLNCYSYHEEEFSIIESLSPEIKVRDVLREFDMITYRESLEEAEKYQNGKL